MELHWDGTDWANGGLPDGQKYPLYNLHGLAALPKSSVIICEGEKCCDKLISFGWLATTSGSSNTAGRADWSPLSGRTVVIWPDKDKPGMKYAQAVIGKLGLLKPKPSIWQVDPYGNKRLARLDEGEDVVDFADHLPKDANVRNAILDVIDNKDKSLKQIELEDSIWADDGMDDEKPDQANAIQADVVVASPAPKDKTDAPKYAATSRVLDALKNVKANSNGWIASCPGPTHKRGDKRPSLSIAEGDKGVLLNCHAGCDTAFILKAIGMTIEELFWEPKSSPGYSATTSVSLSQHIDLNDLPEEELDRPRHTVPDAPDDDYLLHMYDGTVWEHYVRETRAVAPVKPILPITGALALQSALLTPCCTINGKKSNCYAMLIAPSSMGKGVVGRGLMKALRRMDRYGHHGISSINVASNKSLLASLGQNPWGLLNIAEFEKFMQAGHWLADSIPVLNDAYDGDEVSLSSMGTGSFKIYNAAPSMFASIQNAAFLRVGATTFLTNGFLSRTVLSLDDTAYPELVKVGKLNAIEDLNETVLAAQFKAAYYGWLPQPLKPADQQTQEVEENGKTKVRNTGVWEHPLTTLDLTTEPYSNPWETYLIPSETRSTMIRLLKHYLPKCALPFAMKERDFARTHVISADAQRRAEPLILTWYHNLLTTLHMLPESERESLALKIRDLIRKRPGISTRDIQNGIRFGTIKEFKNAMDVLAAKWASAVITVNKNKTKTTRWYLK
jgi:hypothetical protein